MARFKILVAVVLIMVMSETVLSAIGVMALTGSCWIHDDFSSWCEPGTVGCTNWPNDTIVDTGIGAAWGGAGNQDMEFITGSNIAIGEAWGPSNCSPSSFCASIPGHYVILSVDMKIGSVAPANTTAAVGIGLFTNTSVPLTYGSGAFYNNSIYMGASNFPVDTVRPGNIWGKFWAGGFEEEHASCYCNLPFCCFNCTCGVGPNACQETFDAGGPMYIKHNGQCDCPEYLQWGSAADTSWHNFELAFNYDNGYTLLFYDGDYMGYINASGMAGKDLRYQLIGLGFAAETVYWDNFSVGDGTVNGYPLPPTDLLVDGTSNNGCVYNATPNMSCTAWHSNGSYLDLQQIQVSIDSGFHYLVWDSGMMDIPDILSGSTSTIVYNGSSLVWNTKYYWHTKFWDRYGVCGDWSAVNVFTYGAENCGTFGNATPHGIFPPTNMSVYGTDCDPDIFLRDMWRSGATAMGFTCPVTFEQLILGLAAIPVGIAVAFAVNFTMAGVLASVLWFGGLGTMHVYPWWIVLVVSLFLLSIWFTLRRTGA